MHVCVQYIIFNKISFLDTLNLEIIHWILLLWQKMIL